MSLCRHPTLPFSRLLGVPVIPVVAEGATSVPLKGMTLFGESRTYLPGLSMKSLAGLVAVVSLQGNVQRHGTSMPESAVPMPFIICHTRAGGKTDCMMSPDRQHAILSFTDAFQLYDDNDLLRLRKLPRCDEPVVSGSARAGLTVVLRPPPATSPPARLRRRGSSTARCSAAAPVLSMRLSRMFRWRATRLFAPMACARLMAPSSPIEFSASDKERSASPCVSIARRCGHALSPMLHPLRSSVSIALSGGGGAPRRTTRFSAAPVFGGTKMPASFSAPASYTGL